MPHHLTQTFGHLNYLVTLLSGTGVAPFSSKGNKNMVTKAWQTRAIIVVQLTVRFASLLLSITGRGARHLQFFGVSAKRVNVRVICLADFVIIAWMGSSMVNWIKIVSAWIGFFTGLGKTGDRKFLIACHGNALLVEFHLK